MKPESTSRTDASFPLSGEHFVFTSEPQDTAVFSFVFTVDPGGGVTVSHRHADQTETYRCRSGQLVLTVDGERRVLLAGDDVTVPAGALHSLLNEGEDEVVCDVEYRPAGRNREWFQLHSAFQAATGREPGLLDIGAFIGAVGIYVDGPPVPVQKALFVLLRPIARLLGRRRRMISYAREAYGPDFNW